MAKRGRKVTVNPHRVRNFFDRRVALGLGVPTNAETCRCLRISANTLRRKLRELTAAGWVRPVPEPPPVGLKRCPNCTGWRTRELFVGKRGREGKICMHCRGLA